MTRAQFTIDADPTFEQVAKGFRNASKDVKKELGKLNKRFAEIPKNEAVKEANRLGSGWVRLGRSLKTSASTTSIKVRSDKKRYPDAAGWEWGSVQYGQFGAWRGNGADAGYVVAPLARDKDFADGMVLIYANEITEFINDNFDNWSLPFKVQPPPPRIKK